MLTDWDNQGRKGVASDDTSVIHDVLWCDFTKINKHNPLD